MGNTIVVSRGLIDVLPDEASLAMVLSHELAHIVLGHNLGSKFAFNDRMLFSDESTYHNFGFRHNPDEETAADAKAMDLLKNSPYAQKLDVPSLFLKATARHALLNFRALLTAHLGNSFTDDKGQLSRLTALADHGPALDPNKLDQIAALPLGGRVKLNAWDDHVELIKSAPVAITSARDKMPFEVTPFFPQTEPPNRRRQCRECTPQRQTPRRATSNAEDGRPRPSFPNKHLNKLMEAQAGTGSNSGFPAFVFDGRMSRDFRNPIRTRCWPCRRDTRRQRPR